NTVEARSKPYRMNDGIMSRSTDNYTLTDMYHGADFFNEWDFFTGADPTHGSVNYQSKEDAMKKGLAYVQNDGTTFLNVDDQNTLPIGAKRDSIRITTKKKYNGGLFIADFFAMPHGCGVWPAYWSVGPDWPRSGEIDIIEGVHNRETNQYTLHTSSGCTLSSGSERLAADTQVLGKQCASSANSNAGCAFLDKDTRSYGKGFNLLAGGVFVHLWNTDGIKIWHFARDEIPEDISQKRPNPCAWGEPVAFWSSAACNIDSHFREHSLVIDTTLCGDFGTATYPTSGCPGTCAQAVANPNAKDAVKTANVVKTFDRALIVSNPVSHVPHNLGKAEDMAHELKRRDKIRCDGVRPCASCVRKGLECIERACKDCSREGRAAECTHRKAQAAAMAEAAAEAQNSRSDEYRPPSAGNEYSQPPPQQRLHLPPISHPSYPQPPPNIIYPPASHMNHLGPASHYYYPQQGMIGPGQPPQPMMQPYIQHPQSDQRVAYYPAIDPNIDKEMPTSGMSSFSNNSLTIWLELFDALMKKVSSSPERPLVKVTYLERQKKKRKITDTTEYAFCRSLIDPLKYLREASDLSHSSSTSTSVFPTTPNKKAKEITKVSNMTVCKTRVDDPPRSDFLQAPESKESLKVDNHLSGSATKRARRDSDESVKSTVSKKSHHVQATLSRTQPQVPASTSVSAISKKPVSVSSVKRPSRSVQSRHTQRLLTLCRRTASPDTDVDDSASIADSIISVGRTRRNEAQRLEYFKNEPLCRAFTKDAAECSRCGKSVRLGGRTTYRIRPWEMHRAKCDQMPLPADEGPDDSAEISKQRAKTVEQRIDILTADPAVSSLKPHEVLCRNCGTWVRLSNNVPYKITNWRAHTLTCQASTEHQPSDRVAAATRKLQLVNDSQVKSFTEHEVVCVYCGTTVTKTSNGGNKYQGEYHLLAWTEHKSNCTKPLTDSPKAEKLSAIAPDISTIPFPGRPPHSTASVASTEATLIASEKQTLNTHGTKRAREDEESAGGASDDTVSRPTNRARIETNEEPHTAPRTAAGWLALPFQAFIRGFKESLSRN
ncbi:hypothetical protein C0992_007347, partial [Termitomyces sp. T32_za158]